MVLGVPNGVAGQRVRICGGELLGIHLPSGSLPSVSGGAVANTWGYDFVWTMRDGPQVLTQHNYMTFRYASFTFMDAPPPRGLNVSAWGVAYEWDPTDSAFESSNATLNKVWALCENTLRYGVVGTYVSSRVPSRCSCCTPNRPPTTRATITSMPVLPLPRRQVHRLQHEGAPAV